MKILRAAAKKFKGGARNFRPEKGECWNDVNVRAENFLKEVVKREFT